MDDGTYHFRFDFGISQSGPGVSGRAATTDWSARANWRERVREWVSVIEGRRDRVGQTGRVTFTFARFGQRGGALGVSGSGGADAVRRRPGDGAQRRTETGRGERRRTTAGGQLVAVAFPGSGLAAGGKRYSPVRDLHWHTPILPHTCLPK